MTVFLVTVLHFSSYPVSGVFTSRVDAQDLRVPWIKLFLLVRLLMHFKGLVQNSLASLRKAVSGINIEHLWTRVSMFIQCPELGVALTAWALVRSPATTRDGTVGQVVYMLHLGRLNPESTVVALRTTCWKVQNLPHLTVFIENFLKDFLRVAIYRCTCG